jgi:7,8-dihydro-6-hydroxymethylpterin-pyrophosphokinase
MKDEKEFFLRMKDRDPEIILKMVKCVLSAHKRKIKQLNIFEVIFKDSSYMTFAMDKKEFKNFLNNCLQDMINIEEYEICAEIKKIVNRNVRKKKVITTE